MYHVYLEDIILIKKKKVKKKDDQDVQGIQNMAYNSGNIL